METIRKTYEEVQSVLVQVLRDKGFTEDRAKLSASLFVNADRDGVYSHGVNRFLLFLDYIGKGIVKPEKEPELVDSIGFYERWDGQRGPGNLNAAFAMKRCIKLAKMSGFACIALKNTNHWMRGGNVAWQAVEEGCISISFTNTKSNMPAWGGAEPKLGNNPLVIGIPRKKGPVVLDMAMSQFAYGKMSLYAKRGEEMPFDAGFDQRGNLTRSPKEILEHELALPAGLWKGAGLSLVLDMLVTILSGGEATFQVNESGEETGLSQVFICFDPVKLRLSEWMEEKADAIIEDLKGSETFENHEIRYPGERTLQIRANNLKEGIPVDSAVWERIIKQLKK